MSWGGPGFVLALIAISTIGWVITTAIRAKHGYPIENEWSGKSERSDLTAERQARLMAEQNEQLTAKVLRLEERIAVLERIATDPATRTAREIDALR
ncbi:hypothetical protein QLH51_11415 [Sphingomonas sp. 2R-10]|uniref:hypothetical protein n=1 Tax=Sphingomonas sp. 2R-10 TaxID=3045148 RepID=UPI000F7B9690|nr:hypothetical protein [Sphingomonas sp. 2R-10]MDJ0277403.1 hypothetical protein [Sphingomonas sp. 2R-10]